MYGTFFEILVLVLHCCYGDNVKYGLLSKKSQDNNNFLLKTMSLSYQIEQTIFMEASCANNIHTGETVFCNCYIGSLYVVTFGLYVSPLHFQRRATNKYCLQEVNLVFQM